MGYPEQVRASMSAQGPPDPAGTHLLADRPLLALMERPGSGRDLVIDGTLTEPLNTALLS